MTFFDGRESVKAIDEYTKDNSLNSIQTAEVTADEDVLRRWIDAVKPGGKITLVRPGALAPAIKQTFDKIARTRTIHEDNEVLVVQKIRSYAEHHEFEGSSR